MKVVANIMLLILCYKFYFLSNYVQSSSKVGIRVSNLLQVIFSYSQGFKSSLKWVKCVGTHSKWT